MTSAGGRNLAVVLLVLAGDGCRGTELADCDPPSFIPIEYVGGALGDGELRFSRGDGALTAQIVLGPELDAGEASMQLIGTASCSGRVVHVRFTGGDSPASDFRVLGGELLLVLDDEFGFEPFGTWKVMAIHKAREEERAFTGFFRYREVSPQ